MGANQSQLSPQELKAMQQETHFTDEEIKRLYRRFRKLDKDLTGTITKDDFLGLPELAMNPLVDRVVAIFDVNHDESINFKEFITALSVFSAQGSREEKLKFAFKIYDIDGDGFISNGELFQVLKMMVGTNLTDVQLQQIVDKTIIEADLDKDGMISWSEFENIVQDTDLEQKMTIQF
eukprot:c18516_g1_i1.p1 GENE.c18516_g1_i1~~c18516_g1_i1.p1  ORF type:complete len:178 (-),score=51.74 c18516_g1_i1:36-569(-)